MTITPNLQIPTPKTGMAAALHPAHANLPLGVGNWKLGVEEASGLGGEPGVQLRALGGDELGARPDVLERLLQRAFGVGHLVRLEERLDVFRRAGVTEGRQGT